MSHKAVLLQKWFSNVMGDFFWPNQILIPNILFELCLILTHSPPSKIWILLIFYHPLQMTLWSRWIFFQTLVHVDIQGLHPLLVHVVVEWPLSETSILTSTFYLVCQRNISFSEKPWDNYKILVFWVHIFQSRRGYLVSTFFALIIQVSNALSTVPLWITNFCLCIHVTHR